MHSLFKSLKKVFKQCRGRKYISTEQKFIVLFINFWLVFGFSFYSSKVDDSNAVVLLEKKKNKTKGTDQVYMPS